MVIVSRSILARFKVLGQYSGHTEYNSKSFAGFEANNVTSALHRITESQNSRGWKGPLWVI